MQLPIQDLLKVLLWADEVRSRKDFKSACFAKILAKSRQGFSGQLRRGTQVNFGPTCLRHLFQSNKRQPETSALVFGEQWNGYSSAGESEGGQSELRGATATSSNVGSLCRASDLALALRQG